MWDGERKKRRGRDGGQERACDTSVQTLTKNPQGFHACECELQAISAAGQDPAALKGHASPEVGWIRVDAIEAHHGVREPHKVQLLVPGERVHEQARAQQGNQGNSSRSTGLGCTSGLPSAEVEKVGALIFSSFYTTGG